MPSVTTAPPETPSDSPHPSPTDSGDNSVGGSTGESGGRSSWSLLRRRDFSRYLGASLCASTATAAQSVALGALAYDITGRKDVLGYIGLLEFLPAAFLALASGHLADRFDRRRIGAIGAVAELLCAVALALYAASRARSLTPIYLIAFIFGVSRSFAAPAVRSLMPSTVTSEELPRAVPLASLSWQIASIAGPLLGGFTFAIAIWAPFAVAAFLFGITMVLLLSMQPYPVDRTGTKVGWTSVLEGFTLIRRSPILLGAISLDLFAVLFGGAVALLPVYAKEILHVGKGGLGVLRAAPGVGAAITGLALAHRPVVRRVGSTLFAVVAAFGVFTILFAVSRTMWLSLVALALLAAADSVSVFIRGSLVPLVTPVHLRGRVTAVEAVFIGGSNELGAFESGVAAQALGTAPSVVFGGIATLVVAGAWALLFPALRKIDRFPVGPE
jgi:MFS family permease